MFFVIGLGIREFVGDGAGHSVGRHSDLKSQIYKSIGRRYSLICEILKLLNKLAEELEL
jgi:hypothetical protein